MKDLKSENSAARHARIYKRGLICDPILPLITHVFLPIDNGHFLFFSFAFSSIDLGGHVQTSMLRLGRPLPRPNSPLKLKFPAPSLYPDLHFALKGSAAVRSSFSLHVWRKLIRETSFGRFCKHRQQTNSPKWTPPSLSLPKTAVSWERTVLPCRPTAHLRPVQLLEFRFSSPTC